MAVRRKRKSAVSVARYVYLKNRAPQNQKSTGQLSRKALTHKGQIFLVTSTLNDGKSRKAGDVEMTANIIREVYYSHPSDNIIESLNRAFQDANTLVNELLNEKAPDQRSGIKCTAFVITRERGYLAQVGDNHLYRITPQKIDRLTIDTNIVGGKKSFALGLESKINIHFNRYIALTAGDAYLLCTEELHDLEPDLVKQIVSHDSPHHAGQKLFDLVAEKSSKDTLDLQMITINLPLHQSTGGVSPRIWPRKRIWLSATLLFLLTATTTLMLSDKRIVHETEAKKPSPPPMSPSQTPQIVIENSPAELVEEDNPDSVIFAKIKAEQTAAKPSPKIARASKPLDQPAKQPSTTGKTTESIIEPFSAMWNLQNLTEVDYRVSPEKIIFLPTPNLKKALYRSEPLSNFSINVEARIHNTAAGRFGIMVGYRAMGNSPYEVYYLLSLFRQKEFLLQKYSGFRKELVTRIPIAREVLTNNYQTMKIKVTCSGPFIELTANQRQIFRWRTGEEVVKGNIGIFVSPDTEVELSRFEVSDSSDLTRK